PDDPDATPLRRSAERDIVVAEVNRLVDGGEFSEAGKLIEGKRTVIGQTPAEELKGKLVDAWMAYVDKEGEKPKQIKLLRDLLASFPDDKRARSLLETLDPASKKVDPALGKRLADQLAEAEQLLADKPAETLKIVADVLKNEDGKAIPGVRDRANIAKARALAR